MEPLKAATIDIESGQTTFRDLTETEITEYENALNAATDLESKKLALMEKLGLTADDLKLLGL